MDSGAAASAVVVAPSNSKRRGGRRGKRGTALNKAMHEYREKGEGEEEAKQEQQHKQ